MRNTIALIIILFSILISSNILSQTIVNKNYKLNSLENKESLVYIKLDYVNDRITIELNPGESLCINGFRSLEQDISLLNQQFIELHFSIRGGSGVAIRRNILICISNNKLYKAIDVLSMVRSEFNKTYVASIDSLNLYDENSLYKFNLSKLKEDNQNYKLIATEYDKVKSKYDPSQNHETQDTLQFSFDINSKIFYNQFDSLTGSFVINSDDGKLNDKRNFNNETYPVMKLKNNEYYFINQSWYIKDGKNHLTEFSSSCK